jgi:hypothetical protein
MLKANDSGNISEILNKDIFISFLRKLNMFVLGLNGSEDKKIYVQNVSLSLKTCSRFSYLSYSASRSLRWYNY